YNAVSVSYRRTPWRQDARYVPHVPTPFKRKSMSQDLSSAVAVPVSRPAHWVRQAALVVGGTALLTASSYVSIPMQPVPVSLQTFAVLMVGALYGWRLGGLTVLAWLLEAAAGMPVLAGGKGGLAP